MITRFECPSIRSLLVVLALHKRVKRDVRRVADGYLGGATVVSWKTRTVLSISLWQRFDSIYAMGNARAHVLASRVPRRLGVSTSCGIYAYTGEWRRLMFDAPGQEHDPLSATDVAAERSPS